MKGFGLFLIIIGLVGGCAALGMDTSVLSHTTLERVHNIGLMDDRRNYLMISGLLVVVGVLLYGFGSVARNGPASDTRLLRVCPSCAEHIQSTAIVCRFCNREVQPASTPHIDGGAAFYTQSEAESVLGVTEAQLQALVREGTVAQARKTAIPCYVKSSVDQLARELGR